MDASAVRRSALGITDDARTDNYLKTAGQAEAPSPRADRDAGEHHGQGRARDRGGCRSGRGRRRRHSRSTITFRPAGRPRASSLAQKEFSDALQKEANLRINAETRTHIARAVYHVQLQDAEQRVRSGGTAWVVGPNLLATNAHVAILREGLRTRERMIVRAPGQNGQIYEVVEHKLHPGYVPFNAFLQSDLRLISAYRGNLDSLSGNGYDVALLRVAGTLPEADRLEIATPDELNALASGTPLATSGISRRKPHPKLSREISASRRSSTSAWSRR